MAQQAQIGAFLIESHKLDVLVRLVVLRVERKRRRLHGRVPSSLVGSITGPPGTAQRYASLRYIPAPGLALGAGDGHPE